MIELLRRLRDIADDNFPDRAAEQHEILDQLKEWLLPDQLIAGGEPRSPGWEKFAADWVKAHPECCACGGTHMVQCHHKKPFHTHKDLEFAPGNHMSLCMAPNRLCHLIFGHAGDFSGINHHAEEDAAAHLLRIKHRYDKV